MLRNEVLLFTCCHKPVSFKVFILLGIIYMCIRRLLFAVLFSGLMASPANAMFNSFEVGTATIASTFSPNPATFTTKTAKTTKRKALI